MSKNWGKCLGLLLLRFTFISDPSLAMTFVTQFSHRGFAFSAALSAKIQEVVVIGGGLMGAGIAQVHLFISMTETFYCTERMLLIYVI